MRSSEKYSYSKYRSEDRPAGSGRVFVSSKQKYDRNPIINLPPKIWGNIGLIVLIFAIFWLVYYSSYFKIKDVIVEGNSLIPTNSISTQVPLGENIFHLNSDWLKSKILDANPMIADVAIYRGIPDTLKIVVLERKTAMVWQSNNNNYLIDNAGFVDKQISANDYQNLLHVLDQKNMPVKIGSQLLSANFINFANSINAKLFSTDGIHPTGFYITETTFDLYVQTDAGFYLKFDTTRSLNIQLANLQKVLTAHRADIHEYVDLRINGWAYYK